MSWSRTIRGARDARRARATEVGILAVVLALVVACGGAAPVASGAGASLPTGAGQPTAGGPTSTPGGGQPSVPAEATPAQGGQTAVTGQEACPLIPESAWSALATALKVQLAKDPNNACNRESADSLTTASVSIEIGRDAIKSMNSICTDIKPISGLGDEAVWCAAFKTLTAYANNQTVGLQVTSFGTGDTSDAGALAAEQPFIAAVLPVIPKAEIPGAAGAADNKACQLTNQQELSAALGEAVDPPTVDLAPLGSKIAACNFERHNAIGEVALRIYQDASGYEATKAAMVATVEDVPGVGDKAYWATDLKFLEAACGGRMIDVQIVFLEKDSATLKVGATAIAKVACTRL